MLLTDTFLDELYEAIVLHFDFQKVERIIARTIGSHCGLVLHHKGDALTIAESSNLNPETLQRYNNHYFRYDPWAFAAKDANFGDLIVGNENVDWMQFLQTDYFHDVHAISDMWDMLGTRVRISSSEEIFFCFYSSSGHLFGNVEKKRVYELLSHVRRALKLHQAVHGLKHRDSELKFHAYKLTNSEADIVCLIQRGYKNTAIATKLRITGNTLKWHLSNIYHKTGVTGKVQLLSLLLRDDFRASE